MYFSTNTIKKISVIFLLSTVGFFTVYISAKAHTTGSFWEVAAGDYFADVGYDPAVFVAGQYSRFDFGLFKDRADTESINFAEVWVRIKKEKETLLATGIRKQPIGPTTLLYTFQDEGEHSLEVSFRDADGNEIAAASFPVTVVLQDGERTGQNIQHGLFLLLGLVIGVGAGFLVARSKVHNAA